MRALVVALLLAVLCTGCGAGGWGDDQVRDEVANEVASIPAGPPESLTLLVHLDGLSPDVTGTTTVKLMTAYGYGSRRRVEVPAGERVARIDVTHLVRERGVVCVPIHVERLDHVSEPSSFFFPAEEPSSGIYETRVRMAPAILVCGTVKGSQGATRAQTWVALYPLEWTVDRSRWRAPCDAVLTDDDGSFRLAAQRPGRYLAVATQIDGGMTWSNHLILDEGEWLPDGTVVALEEDRTVVVRDLVLRPACTLEGTVRVRGRTRPGLRVEAQAVHPEESLLLQTEEWPYLVWTGEQVVPFQASAYGVEADGRFHIEGLAPGLHDVSLDSGWHDMGDPELENAAPLRVRAPSRGVEIDVDAVVVHVRPRDRSGPLDVARVFVETQGETLQQWARPDQPASFLLRAGTSYMVRATADGHGTTIVRCDVPRDEDEITLEISLKVLDAVDPDDCGSVRARVLLDDDVLQQVSVCLEGTNEQRIHLEPADDAPVHVATGVPAGDWILRVSTPDVSEASDHDAVPYALPVAMPVCVSPGRETEVEAECAEGGLLEIAVRDAHSRCIGADVVLRGPRGDVLEVWFAACLPSASPLDRGWSHCPDGLLPQVPSLVDRALPAGDYEIEIQMEGVAPRFRTVEVAAGRVTRVSFATPP